MTAAASGIINGAVVRCPACSRRCRRLGEFCRLVDDWWGFTNVLIEFFLIFSLLILLVAVYAKCDHAGRFFCSQVAVKTDGIRYELSGHIDRIRNLNSGGDLRFT